MDVTKTPLLTPLLDPSVNRQGSAAPTLQQTAASLSSPAVTALVDRLDIHPLDLAAALQILIAEVRTDLESSAESLVTQTPAQTSRVLIRMFLDAVLEGAPGLPAVGLPQEGLPDEGSPAVGLPAVGLPAVGLPQEGLLAVGLPEEEGAALARIELAFRSAIDRAVETIASWRDVPRVVVDAAEETRTLVASQLAEQAVSPLWARPEWLGLAPRVQRFWRRRRAARRRLTDPDLSSFRGADGCDTENAGDEQKKLHDPL